MHAKVILSILATFSLAVGSHAQTVSLSTMPKTQGEGTPSTTYTITPTVTGNFTATIYLRASSPTLPGATFAFSPTMLNLPFQQSSQLTVTISGAKAAGDHPIIIEGYNGPLLVRDTCMLTILDRPAWRVFDKSNSPLPSNLINCIAIDRDGVGWIGTDRGLGRFDGTTWTIFTVSDSVLLNNSILSIAVDSTNGIWVATSGGLSELRNGVWKKHQPSSETACVAAQTSGSIWVGSGKALRKLDGTNITTYDPSNSPIIIQPEKIVVDRSNMLWIIGSGNGVDRFDGTYWTHLNVDELGFAGYAPIANIAIDLVGNVWLATERGLIQFDGTLSTVYPVNDDSTVFPGPTPDAMCFDHAGTMWIGTSAYRTTHFGEKNGGLGRYDGVNAWFYHSGNSGLPYNAIFDIKADSRNTIWIGTSAGLALLDGNAAPLIAFTSVEDDTAKTLVPLITSIAPHPVSGVSTIRLDLVESTHVRLALHNSRGQEVVVLCDRMLDKGERLIQIDATTVPVGVYVLRLVAGEVVESRPLIVSR